MNSTIASMYCTARTNASCVQIAPGTYVSVSYLHHDDHGVAWFRINRTAAGPLDHPVTCPETHLESFVL